MTSMPQIALTPNGIPILYGHMTRGAEPGIVVQVIRNELREIGGRPFHFLEISDGEVFCAAHLQVQDDEVDSDKKVAARSLMIIRDYVLWEGPTSSHISLFEVVFLQTTPATIGNPKPYIPTNDSSDDVVEANLVAGGTPHSYIEKASSSSRATAFAFVPSDEPSTTLTGSENTLDDCLMDCLRNDGPLMWLKHSLVSQLLPHAGNRKRNMNDVLSRIFDDDLSLLFSDDERKVKTRRSRRYYRDPVNMHPTMSCWYQTYIISNEFSCANSSRSRLFRNRFRMTREAFLQLVHEARENDWFPQVEKPDALGTTWAPLELLMLGSLAYLGGALQFEMLPDMTFISSQTHRNFFTEFITICSTRLYSRWVRPPDTPEEIADCMKGYEDAGLPGCICSTDATHIRLWQCPHNLRNSSTGKAKYPTRAFQISVNYKTQILATTKGYQGTWNDKIITKYDTFLKKLRNNEIYDQVSWNIVDRQNNVTHLKGNLWSICDGGYPSWHCLVPPYKHTSDPEEMAWSKWIESLRKDSERTIGILKNRFRILKFGVTLQKLEDVDRVFMTCCALHNMLLALNAEPDDYTHEVLAHETVSGGRILASLNESHAELLEHNSENADSNGEYASDSFGVTFHEFRKQLVEHFMVKQTANQLKWPSRTGHVNLRNEE